MQRREFIRLAGAGVVWPLAARAADVKHVGVLMNGIAANTVAQTYVRIFVAELGDLGWTEHQNLQIDLRWNAGEPALARTYAKDLIGLRPDVILSSSTTNLVAVREVAHRLPIVFVEVADPVAQGFVASMDHPGENITGFTAFRTSMAGQWLYLLKEIAPDIARVLVIFNPETSPQSKLFLNAIAAAAPSLGVEVVPAPVMDAAEIEQAIERFSNRPNGSVIVPSDTFTQMRRGLFVELTARYSLPAIYSSPDFVKNGGLMYYGFDFAEQFRRAAHYVDKILRGTSPGDLPIEQPNKLALIINLKTAKALGLTVPAQLIARADEAID
jgi:putative tryptophan/tyrosine transport system substrate-binding protein